MLDWECTEVGKCYWDLLMNSALMNTCGLARALGWAENNGKRNWYHSVVTIQWP